MINTRPLVPTPFSLHPLSSFPFSVFKKRGEISVMPDFGDSQDGGGDGGDGFGEVQGERGQRHGSQAHNSYFVRLPLLPFAFHPFPPAGSFPARPPLPAWLPLPPRAIPTARITRGAAPLTLAATSRGVCAELQTRSNSSAIESP